jgi:hypothetical protein
MTSVMQVLVVHIARFTYEEGQNGTVKVKCPVHHNVLLDMKQEWFADNAPVKQAQYRLVAKVVHKGVYCRSQIVMRWRFCASRHLV